MPNQPNQHTETSHVLPGRVRSTWLLAAPSRQLRCWARAPKGYQIAQIQIASQLWLFVKYFDHSCLQTALVTLNLPLCDVTADNCTSRWEDFYLLWLSIHHPSQGEAELPWNTWLFFMFSLVFTKKSFHQKVLKRFFQVLSVGLCKKHSFSIIFHQKRGLYFNFWLFAWFCLCWPCALLFADRRSGAISQKRTIQYISNPFWDSVQKSTR